MKRYRLWWIPQLPGTPFTVESSDLSRLKWLEFVLAEYDQFQLDQHIKPDYSNAGGIEVHEDGEWTDLDDDDYATAG